MNGQYRAGNIQTEYLNNKGIQFDLFELVNDGFNGIWQFCGHFTAPTGTPEGDLVGFALGQIESLEFEREVDDGNFYI
ncbi:hypothetical protein TAO_1318 [Candidatus Nitrosoglobus terrae]|uniref:Uncharacterized protein n=1 Tax=Candidatus Nitrosoglobus terrae TaxID=1630141 RepID=A0A1Q2SNG4_9GAMM|nr:hypothetical protein [Candidatus Nitrosoglobus terrae]BAW80688.1 hypothetical protein TAO_1318 [Candidatus Nitrosoglobus terrae]